MRNNKKVIKRVILFLACIVCVNLRAELFYSPQMIQEHLKGYSDEEVQLLQRDLGIVRSICFDGKLHAEKPFYLATAGAPGARKTTILEKFVSIHPEYQEGVYIDPDARSLKFMAHTYYAKSLSPLVISSSENYLQALKNAYTKWRAGSNYIVLTLFEEATAAGHSIIYGTTSTGAHTPTLLTKLKENGYQIVLLLCSCQDALRYDSIEYRNTVVRFYQSSPEDALTKGKLFPQKMETYFTHADLMYLYWSDDLFSQERLAAIWSNGKMEILDPEALELFIDKYETDRIALEPEGTFISPFETFLRDK